MAKTKKRDRRKRPPRDERLDALFAGDVVTPDEQKLDPRQRRTRQRLLDAASTIFARDGYAGATTRRIAEEAGVAEKTLFAHFGSKGALFAAAFAPGLGELMGASSLAEVLVGLTGPEVTTAERLRAIAADRASFASNNRELIKSVVQELLLDDGFRQRMAAYWSKHILPGLGAVLGAGIASGELRDIPPQRLVRHVVSGLAGFVVMRFVLMPNLEDDPSWDDEAEVEATIDMILRGITRD